VGANFRLELKKSPPLSQAKALVQGLAQVIGHLTSYDAYVKKMLGGCLATPRLAGQVFLSV
jgi:hypothetical protein